jgi:hypothetical protein
MCAVPALITNEASPQTHEVYRQKMSRGKWG